MRVPHGTTILVADGRKRLVARNDGEADAPSLTVVQAVEEAPASTSDIASDAAGRASGVGARGMGGGAPIETADPQDHAEERFAVETALMLRRGVEDGQYEKLIIVAAPKTLGTLRKHFHKIVSDKIIGEVGKDVTSQPMSAIEKLLIAQ